ncbi:MAG TPA: ABC transporter permease [Candidatus Sulfopaludibacter sp.]|nr:ABC transporter permease [Candidatus Sulfopaludibacter sp.]
MNFPAAASVVSNMETFVADLRYAVRMLRKNPAFTAIAVLALALGIGANTAIFTVVDAVLLQPLPYPQPERIVKLGRAFAGDTQYSNSIPKFMAWRQNHVFQSITLYSQNSPGVNMGNGDRPQQVKGLAVSSEFFDVFGVRPLQGRVFTASEDVPKGPALAVISYRLWQTHFGGDPQMVGRAIPLNGAPVTVVGILPANFESDPAADLWTPLQADPNSTNQGHYLSAAARLKPGVTLEAAQAEMKVLAGQFRRAYPKSMNEGESATAVPMRDATVGNVRTALLVLLGAVSFVLLIACANVANLLLARAAVRQREMAVRAAIGASRGRVVRQLLTESVLLSGIGGALGFVLGTWGVRVLLLLVPGRIPRLTGADGIQAVAPPLDWRIAAFTLGIALLTGILFGLFPALQVSNPDLASSLKETSGRSGTGRRQNRTRSILVVTEVALALVLLTGAALLIRSFIGLRGVKPGIDARRVLTFETATGGAAYDATAKVERFATQSLRRLEGLPGVEAAALTVMLPASGHGGMDLPFNIAGHAPEKGDQYNGDEQYRFVSAHYFQVFRIPVLRGRSFTEADTGNAPRVVIINEKLANQYWPKQDPIGQVMVIGKGLGPEFEDPPRQVVGVVGNVRETGVADGEQAVMYVPQSQLPDGLTKLAHDLIPLAWGVRTAMDPMSLRAAVEREFRAVDPLMGVAQERSMEEVLSQAVSRQNFNMLLLSIFAAIAMLLAAIGIYGLMSYSVEQRTQEIGIRVALGASRGEMLGLIMRQGMKLAGIGVAVGLVIAYGVTKLLASLLFGIKSTDPVTFVGVAAILIVVAVVATYIPASRAAGTQPTEALRYQ